MIKCGYPRYEIISAWIRTQIMQLCKDCFNEFRNDQYLVVESEDQEDLGAICQNCGREHT